MSSRPPRFGMRDAAKQRRAASRLRQPRLSAPIGLSTLSSAKPIWPGLSSSMAVAVVPLRNLTGDSDWRSPAEAVTEDLVSHLLRHGRAFSLQRIADESGTPASMAGLSVPRTGYVVDGSVQRGTSGMLRFNMRIRDAVTTEYLWARRYEYLAEQVNAGETLIVHQISRELHLLLLQSEILSRRQVSGDRAGAE